jgi:dTMP kinase
MGKLFVIDGTDGSGKQTQFKKLQERLTKEGIEYKTVSFPNYDSPSSSLAKMYLSGEFGEDPNSVSPYITSTFFAVDRYATFKKGFQEYYDNGGIILADRYTTANMIQQAGKIKDEAEREKFINWLCDLEFNLYGLPKPTQVFFLNMPIKVSMKLMEKRENKFSHTQEKDIHERNPKYLEDSYKAACSLVPKYDWNEIKCVDENEKIKTIDEIHEEIYEVVKKELNLND